jgi:5-formyltetrahydrofolate cyclo-ligase
LLGLRPPRRQQGHLNRCPPDGPGGLALNTYTPDKDKVAREAKAVLRKLVLSRRGVEPPARLIELNRRIEQNLPGIDLWRACRFPCIYISAKPGEVNTHGLIRGALEQGRRVCVPITHPGSPDLEVVEITSLDPLVSGHFGLLDPAPENCRPLNGPEWDLVIAPGVAFDRRGHRIGFGRGYYDRLLARTKTPAIALAFSFQIVPEFEVSEYDIDMDYIVTDEEVIIVRPRKP